MSTQPKQHDALGRVTFHNNQIDKSIKYSKLGLDAFEFLNLHQHANSDYLAEYLGCNAAYARRLLLRMRRGGYLWLPQYQRESESPQYNRYIYRLSERGTEALINERRYEDTITVSQNSRHDYGVACVTGSIHLECRKAGITYVPGHQLLARADTTLSYDIGKKTLRPDQLFAIDYGDKRRVFAVEFDRGTERYASKTRSKHYGTAIDDYRAYVGEGRYKDHLKLAQAGMLVLFVFSRYVDELAFHRKISQKLGKCA